MSLYDFDSEQWLGKIDKQLVQVLDVNNTFSDKRESYRKLANIIGINEHSLIESCKNFEKSLLINCYTFMEQLVKNIIYSLLEESCQNNENLECFVISKMNPKTFSPGVTFNDIKSLLQRDFGITLEIVFSKKEVLTAYDKMVQARHDYAHKGEYLFDTRLFKEIIPFLYSFNYEISLLCRDKVIMESFCDISSNLKCNVEKVMTIEKSIKNTKHRIAKKGEINQLYSSIKGDATDFVNKLSGESQNFPKVIKIFYNLCTNLKYLKTIHKKDFKNKVHDLYNIWN